MAQWAAAARLPDWRGASKSALACPLLRRRRCSLKADDVLSPITRAIFLAPAAAAPPRLSVCKGTAARADRGARIPKRRQPGRVLLPGSKAVAGSGTACLISDPGGGCCRLLERRPDYIFIIPDTPFGPHRDLRVCLAAAEAY